MGLGKIVKKTFITLGLVALPLLASAESSVSAKSYLDKTQVSSKENLTKGMEQVYTSPDVNSKGKLMLVQKKNKRGDFGIYIQDLDTHKEYKLIDEPGVNEQNPIFKSKDNKRFVFDSDKGGNRNIYQALLNLNLNNGSISATDISEITFDGKDQYSPATCTNGRLAYVTTENGNPDIVVWNSDSKNRSLVESGPSIQNNPALSPDGKYMAFREHKRRDNGRVTSDVMVRNLDSGKIYNLTSDENHNQWAPTFSKDGKMIFYVSSEEKGTPQIFGFDVSEGMDKTKKYKLTLNDATHIEPAAYPKNNRFVCVSQEYDQNSTDGTIGHIFSYKVVKSDVTKR